MNWILFEEITDYMENHLTQISITGLSEEFHFQEDDQQWSDRYQGRQTSGCRKNDHKRYVHR